MEWVLGVVVFVGLIYVLVKEKKTPTAPFQSRDTSQGKSHPIGNRRSSSRHQSSTDIRGYIDDDGLASFFHTPIREESSSNMRTGEWVKHNESVELNGYRIDGGNFYFGGQLPSLSHSGKEASLIDDHLPISEAEPDYSDETLNYWPEYNKLSPECRDAYLKWLSSNRDKPGTPIGYIFLYFYGIERRIIHDSQKEDVVSDDEFSLLAEEIRRLILIYGSNSSFSFYAPKLLEWMKILRPHVVQLSPDEIGQHGLRMALAMHVGQMALDKKPIDAETALSWLWFTGFTKRTPVHRCAELFVKLFRQKYSNKYGDGIVITPNRTFIAPYYHPASRTLRDQVLDKLDIPDPVGKKSIQNKLLTLGEDCVDLLDPYSRHLGRIKGDDPGLEGLLLLPDELLESQRDTTLSRIRNWATRIIQQSDGLVPVKIFWAQISDTSFTKINKKEATLLQSVADKAGFGIAPDPRWHDVKPDVDDKVVLFEDPPGPDFEPSAAFHETGMSLRLGAMVAQGDGSVHSNEAQLLKDLIEEHPKLRAVERRSLLAYLQYRLNNKPNTAGLKAHLAELSDDAKHAISRFLVSMALADGTVTSDEVRHLEKLFTQLGLDKSLVTSDVHVLTASRAPERRIGSADQTPRKQDKTDKQEQLIGREAFKLDEAVLAFHANETRDVQSMLGRIFAEEGAEEDKVEEGDSPKPVPSQVSADILEGLDAAHSALYRQMSERETWSRRQVETLCNEMNLMVDGALETINEWAFETVDDAVFEDEGDSIYMRPDVIDEIEEKVE